MIKKVVILAAGKGTTLKPLTLAMPKEMIRVGVKPVIEHAIEVLKAGDIKDISIIVGRKIVTRASPFFSFLWRI